MKSDNTQLVCLAQLCKNMNEVLNINTNGFHYRRSSMHITRSEMYINFYRYKRCEYDRVPSFCELSLTKGFTSIICTELRERHVLPYEVCFDFPSSELKYTIITSLMRICNYPRISSPVSSLYSISSSTTLYLIIWYVKHNMFLDINITNLQVRYVYLLCC